MYIDNVTYKDTSTSVSFPTELLVPVSYQVYGLSGNYITDNIFKLKNGIYIKRTVFENGEIKSSKLIINKK
jgi:hypothetical protein